MERQGFVVLYPDAATESLFAEFLSGLEPGSRRKVIDAILDLERDPTPRNAKSVRYSEVNPEVLKVFLRMLPGIPFEKGEPGVYLDYLRARHRITIEGVMVAYSVDDDSKYVWLIGVRKASR